MVHLKRSVLFAASLLVLASVGFGASPALALSYRLVPAELPSCKGQCPGVIVATGTIRQNEGLELLNFIQANAGRNAVSKLLVIESPGGFNVGGATLGAVLRKLNMTVIVGRSTGEAITASSGLAPSTCASACVLVLAGGTKRFFVPGSRVGVHRSHTGPEVRDPVTRQVVNGRVNNDDVKSAYAAYFKQMGVAQGLAEVMDKTDSGSMYWLSAQEMTKFKLAQDASKRR
jgi:hypothetical protein